MSNIYPIIGMEKENKIREESERFSEHLKWLTQQAEERHKVEKELSRLAKEERRMSIDTLENGSLEDKVNLLARKYLTQLKQEEEREERIFQKNMEALGISYTKNLRYGFCPHCGTEVGRGASSCFECGVILDWGMISEKNHE